MKRALVLLTIAFATTASLAPAQQPVISYSCDPAPASCGGWYRQPVTVRWVQPSGTTIVEGCRNEPVNFDTASTFRYCEVEDQNGVRSRIGVPLKVDMTPPVITEATASRAPDANGWYRSPLQVTFSGADALSGLVGCTSAPYGGPDNPSATVTGTCTDKAGNVSEASAFGLRYDATAPAVDHVTADAGDHVVRLDWAVADAAVVELWRSPGLDGEAQSVVNRGTDGRLVDRRVRNGQRYDYRLLAVDEAGNLATQTFSAVPGPRLLAPARGARVDGAPTLRWTEVRGARYYNVQLFRGDRKVLSAWPTKPRLQLDNRWRFDGHRHRLKPGRRYRWMVWPGRGGRSRNDYGRLIGSATFSVS
jgi:hypothetical protein